VLYLGVAGVVAGVFVVAPVSAGSTGVAAGVVVVPLGAVSLAQAPTTAAKLSITAKPKILVFITPLSPIVAIKISCLLNTITYLLLIF
jgi:hypothetical protein